MLPSGCIRGVLILLVILTSGCAYRLHQPMPPATIGIRLSAQAVESFTLKVQEREYPVASDGAVEFQYVGRHGCSVYLFNIIPIRSGPDPFRAKSIEVRRAGVAVRRLSLQEVTKLPKADSGYHLLSIPPPRQASGVAPPK